MAYLIVKHTLPDDFGERFEAIPRGYDLAEWDRWREHDYGSSDGFPHCESRMLHAPGECAVCDLYPARQRQRLHDGIAFTGHKAAEGETPCPCDLAVENGERGDPNQWYGNVAQGVPTGTLTVNTWLGGQIVSSSTTELTAEPSEIVLEPVVERRPGRIRRWLHRGS